MLVRTHCFVEILRSVERSGERCRVSGGVLISAQHRISPENRSTQHARFCRQLIHHVCRFSH